MVDSTALYPQYNPSGTGAMLSFFTGALDLAYMGSSPLTLGYTLGLPIRAVSAVNKHEGTLAILRPRRQAVSDRRPTLGTVIGSDGQVLAHEFAAAVDEDVMVVNLAPKECVEALTLGMVDYAALWEPWVSISVSHGAEVVFSDLDLEFGMYSYLAASETALTEKGDAVEHYVGIQSRATGMIPDDIGPFADRLRLVFGPELTTNEYRNVLRQGYSWFSDSFLGDSEIPDDVLRSLERVVAIHADLGNTPGGIPSMHGLFDFPEPSPGQSGVLTLGYSNSIMCTAYHAAEFSGLLDESAFDLQRPGRPVSERIAALDREFQADMQLCHELLDRDPQLVVQKVGRMSEELFRNVEEKLLKRSSKTIAATLEHLGENKLIPTDILSWAHSIRSIRNVASHENGRITRDQAHTAFNITLSILEWFEREQELLDPGHRCPRCSRSIEADWVACPYCDKELSSACAGCGKELEAEWKRCPFCGAKA